MMLMQLERGVSMAVTRTSTKFLDFEGICTGEPKADVAVSPDKI